MKPRKPLVGAKAERELPEGAIGHKDDMNPEDYSGMHISREGFVFETEEGYLDHVSPTTGYTPRDIEHQDALTNGAFSRISEKALERGSASASKASKKKK